MTTTTNLIELADAYASAKYSYAHVPSIPEKARSALVAAIEAQAKQIEEKETLANAWYDAYVMKRIESEKKTKQIEALQAEVERLKYEVDAIPAIKEERDQLRAQLAALQCELDNANALVKAKIKNSAALQYDGELPEPVGYLAWKDGKPCWKGDDCVCEDAVYPVCSDDDRMSKAIYTADQVRQAIAKAKQAPQWLPIETAPVNELILVGPTKRMGICAAMNHSREGWCTETCSDWVSIYTPTHWMQLPAAPSPKE